MIAPLCSDPSLATATLNNLSAIIKTRPPMASKIINAVLSFNPLAGAARGLTIGNRLLMVSMEKTARVLLLNVVRYHPPQYVTRTGIAVLTRLQIEPPEPICAANNGAPAAHDPSQG